MVPALTQKIPVASTRMRRQAVARPGAAPQAAPGRVVCVTEEITMAVGTVKWFNATKGYGFIQPADGGADVFVHVTAVQRAGLHSLAEGQRIRFEVVRDRGKLAADNLGPAD